jgi:hypothetical protein
MIVTGVGAVTWERGGEREEGGDRGGGRAAQEGGWGGRGGSGRQREFIRNVTR